MTRQTHDQINDHFTTETDTTKVLQPNGTGGVVFNTPAASGGGPGLLNPANIIGPFTISGNTNNWSPAGLLTADVIEFTTTSNFNLTGISSVFAAQWSLALVNTGSNNLVLKNQDSGSSGFNRFALPGNADVTIEPGGGVVLFYDAVIENWFVLSEAAAPAGGGGGMTVDVVTIVRASGSYTWTKPANAKTVEVILVGAGGGGGGGGDESSGALGGSGGGGGGMSRRLFQASDLGSTEVTEPGQGGSGGSAGSSGTTGGNSYFGADHLTSPKDAKLTAGGGIGGVAGVSGLTRQNGSAPGFGNQASAIGRWDRNAPTSAQYLPFFSGGSSVEPMDFYSTGSSDFYCGGGGAGGGISSGTTPRAGGNGGAPVEQGGGNSGNNGPLPFASYAAGGTVGAGQNGGAGHTITTQALYYGGYGGGGGAGRHQSAATAGNGGGGSLYGGGGGGGGAGNSASSVTAGAGGDGADGVVVVITYCSA